MPTLLPRTAMRLSEAVFGDFPLTPHKVRTEQEQKAEQKHFKRHGRKTERGAALRKCNERREKTQSAREGLTKRDREGQEMEIQSLLSADNQSNKHVRAQTHTHSPDKET